MKKLPKRKTIPWRRVLMGAGGVVVVALVIYQLFLQSFLGLGSNLIVKDGGDNVSEFSAVFLTNNQIYFGKIHHGNSSAPLDLREVYYLQVNPQVQAGGPTPSTNQNSVLLVKLGDDFLGANSEMKISRNQILFIESLKKDSQVVKAIADYKKK